jgi:hypothetical protein
MDPGVAKMPLPMTRDMTMMYALCQLSVRPRVEVSGRTSSSIAREGWAAAAEVSRSSSDVLELRDAELELVELVSEADSGCSSGCVSPSLGEAMFVQARIARRKWVGANEFVNGSADVMGVEEG